MTAATKDAYIKLAVGNQQSIAVEASEVIYDGALVGSNGSGYAQALAAGDVFLGINVDGQVDNSSGAAGDKDVLVRTEASIQKSVTGVASIEDIGKLVYATDDSTFTIVPPASGSIVGRVGGYVSSGVAIVNINVNDQMSEDGLGISGVGAVPAQLTTASALTLTAAQILSGFVRHDPSGGAATDTLPTAALLIAAIPNAAVGTKFEFVLQNDADAAETITVAAGTGGTLAGTATIAQNNSKRFLVEITNITAGSLAYNVFSLGTFVY